MPGYPEIVPWPEAAAPFSLPSAEAPSHPWITSAVVISTIFTITFLPMAGVLIFIKQYSQGRQGRKTGVEGPHSWPSPAGRNALLPSFHQNDSLLGSSNYS